MRLLAGALLILVLAACSKQEPPPAVAAAPEPSGHSSSAKTSEDRNAPPAAKSPTPADTPAPPPPADFLAQGEMIFKRDCATCHMADGSGVPYLQPAIKGSAWIAAADPQLLLSLILRGSAILGEAAKAYDNDMAPQDHLSDTEIAALATYVRQRFVAPPIAKPVAPAEVAIARSRPGLPQ